MWLGGLSAVTSFRGARVVFPAVAPTDAGDGYADYELAAQRLDSFIIYKLFFNSAQFSRDC